MTVVEKQEVLIISLRREILVLAKHLALANTPSTEVRKYLVANFGLSNYRAKMIQQISCYGSRLLIKVYLSGRINEAVASEIARMEDPAKHDEVLRALNLHWYAKGIQDLGL